MHSFEPINPFDYRHIVFFTGAGMSAESGVPTYRGEGGIWNQYRWEEVACQQAFEDAPEKVLDFHEIRRAGLFDCHPHQGHRLISALQGKHPDVAIITQNIDGMHQRAGSSRVVELHGSVWRLRCDQHGKFEDRNREYRQRHCPHCRNWLRPDITWFGDALDGETFGSAEQLCREADLVICIGTSGAVYPAASLPILAYDAGADLLHLNPEPPEQPQLYRWIVEDAASRGLGRLFSRLSP